MGAKPISVPAPSEIVRTVGTKGNLQWLTAASVLGSDLLTLFFVFGLAVIWRHILTPAYPLRSCLEMLPCVALLTAAFAANGLYPGILLHPAEEMRRVFNCITGVFLLIAAFTFLLHNAQSLSRSVFLVSWAIGAPLVLLTRHLTRTLLSSKSWWGVPAVILGSGTLAQRVADKLRDGQLGIRVIGTLPDPSSQARMHHEDASSFAALNLTGRISSATGAAQYCIVAMPEKSNLQLRHIIEDYCHGFRHVLLVPDMPGLCSLGISARELGGEVGFELPQKLFHTGAAFVKRSLDLLAACLILLIAAPIFLLIALLVRITSRGPVLYGQTRLGEGGRTFKALKFRTMVQNADAILAEHLLNNPRDLLEWKRDHKLKNDPRVTKPGKWLRRLSLDELPQLINVVVGQMSLVGPRPIVSGEIEKYGRGYQLYSRVRPGLTGLWQVSGRNNTTYDERVAFDEYYVRNWSIWLDAYILVRTVKVVLMAEGAY